MYLWSLLPLSFSLSLVYKEGVELTTNIKAYKRLFKWADMLDYLRLGQAHLEVRT